MENPAVLLKDVMRHWASGVAVVTSRCGSTLTGTTISSFTSLSVEPPLVLVNLAVENPTQTMIQESGVFGITLLGEDQEGISNLFAGYNKEIRERFNGLKTFTLESGAPLLEGGLAYLDCKVYSSCVLPKSVVIVGEVVASKIGNPLASNAQSAAPRNGAPEPGEAAKLPLVYLNRGYVHVKAQ